MIEQMKSTPKTSNEYAAFENVLKTVLSVPRDEMKRREDEYQRERGKQKAQKKSSGRSRRKKD
jgi:hypothetical protein